MASRINHNGNTSNIVRFKLTNATTGQGITGLAANSGGFITTNGLIISTIADKEGSATVYTVAATHIQTIATIGTYAAPSASCCRFGEVDATNHPGLYEFQFADARFSVSGATQLVITASGAANLLQADYEMSLDPPANVTQTNGNNLIDGTYNLTEYIEAIGATTAGANPTDGNFKNLDGSKTVVSGTDSATAPFRSAISYSFTH
jgi:hypothetical protein